MTAATPRTGEEPTIESFSAPAVHAADPRSRGGDEAVEARRADAARMAASNGSAKPELMFGYLPTDIFRPFSGSARRFYADLLEYLDTDLFGFTGEIITRKVVIDAIGEFIERQAGEVALDHDGLALAAAEREDNDPRRYIAYARLLATGWLIESRDRYRRTVDFDPSARLLLQALLDIKSGRLRSYGGAVLRVLTLLESAKGDPTNRSENIREAQISARTFMNHLRTVSGSMRKAEEFILAQRELKSLFRHFFEDFVETFVVEDWKRLHTRENPFRFRTQIRVIGQQALDDELLLRELGAAYAREGRASDDVHGRDTVVGELHAILKVFNAVDDHIELIESTNQRIERRITNTVRFMDRIAESRTERLLLALRRLGESPAPLNGDVDVLPRIVLADPPTSGAHLYQSARQQAEIGPQKLKRAAIDPAVHAFRKAVLAFQDRTTMTPTKVAAYLERALAGRAELDAAAFPIQTIDDFLAFERLREIPSMADGVLARAYALVPAPGLVENDWIRCANFVVRRLATETRHAGAD